MKIWVDDLRPVPSGYIGTRSVNETIQTQIRKRYTYEEGIDTLFNLQELYSYIFEVKRQHRGNHQKFVLC